MKKRLISILAGGLLLVGLFGTSASPAFALDGGCGNNVVSFRAYQDINYGTLLGTLCPAGLTIMADINFNDSTGAFRTSDNDKLSSWRFYNSSGSTWCLWIHEHSGYGGTTQKYELSSQATAWGVANVGSGFNDKASSVQAWKKSAYPSTPCT